MADLPFATITPPDPVQLSRNLNRIADRSQRLVQDFLSRSPELGSLGMSDPASVGSAFIELTTKMMADPSAVAHAQIDLWNENLALWQQMTGRFFGLTEAQDQRSDRRFKNPEWTKNAVFDYIKQSYLISSKAILSSVHGVKGLDQNSARKVDFYSRQFVDAISPSNFVATNPEVLRTTLESGGENLVNGLANLLEDIERGKGRLSIKMTDMEAFRLGENLATTPGKVIYQNEMMQLIQYAPSTKKVRKTPLLIVPPWINKFYVLDLKPQNSFVRWLVGQGHAVFVISWVNPDARLSGKGFEDYMKEGPLAALDAIETATGEREANLIGYCLGGTLLACTAAYLTATRDNRIKSATYLVTMVDFTDVGDMAVFIDEEQLAALETRMQERGFLEARDMATSFNLLRANDLVWSFVVSNYLLGKEPLPFDLLFWNADATRMPAVMHSFYLRKMYHENRLSIAGGITLAGVPIDLRRIETPTFMLSTREDHIAPWRSTYAATKIYKGPIKFVLSASGHMAGVISPPGGKYGHWQNDTLPETPDEWMAGATAHAGSWWPVWDEWVSEHSGGLVKARQPGTGALKSIEDAPGSYVRVRAET
ncbi:polyhydroxyalkanoate synthase [Rhizobiales bacterium GAS191]|nr:polyhydroxyalkanoate synthase [Rhizobiales bacterium GAS113]SEE34314.1 polyhydroxyalkanoate synthase [Rhizobiales bacterium GAS191]